jgi:hypothetical protein
LRNSITQRTRQKKKKKKLECNLLGCAVAKRNLEKKTIALGAAASGDPSTVLPGEATG